MKWLTIGVPRHIGVPRGVGFPPAITFNGYLAYLNTEGYHWILNYHGMVAVTHKRFENADLIIQKLFLIMKKLRLTSSFS